jgi:hypothetical protein
MADLADWSTKLIQEIAAVADALLLLMAVGGDGVDVEFEKQSTGKICQQNYA